MTSEDRAHSQEHHRQSDEWVKTSLIATVITVVIGIVGFSIQITNLARVYEQRQTTVEVKLQSIQEDVVEIKREFEEK
jgi:uncharacterized membrane-anchored protein YhcB (DUF1043 family)